jgi:hypothetical protein
MQAFGPNPNGRTSARRPRFSSASARRGSSQPPARPAARGSPLAWPARSTARTPCGACSERVERPSRLRVALERTQRPDPDVAAVRTEPLSGRAARVAWTRIDRGARRAGPTMRRTLPPWSSGPGRLPFTQEVTGSNPVGGMRRIAFRNARSWPWMPARSRRVQTAMEAVWKLALGAWFPEVNLFVGVGPRSGGPHTWDFVPGSDARGEIPSTATERVDDAPSARRGRTPAGSHARSWMRRTGTWRADRRDNRRPTSWRSRPRQKPRQRRRVRAGWLDSEGAVTCVNAIVSDAVGRGGLEARRRRRQAAGDRPDQEAARGWRALLLRPDH